MNKPSLAPWLSNSGPTPAGSRVGERGRLKARLIKATCILARRARPVSGPWWIRLGGQGRLQPQIDENKTLKLYKFTAELFVQTDQ